jgi:hypothetical protein
LKLLEDEKERRRKIIIEKLEKDRARRETTI